LPQKICHRDRRVGAAAGGAGAGGGRVAAGTALAADSRQIGRALCFKGQLPE